MTAASGYGLLTLHPGASGDTVLDAWFPSPVLGATEGDAPAELTALEGDDDTRGVRREVRLVEIADLDAAPATTEDAWLRLHLLSTRLVKPHGQSLDGVFGLLTNVVWTSAGPCAVEGFEATRARLRAAGHHVTVHGEPTEVRDIIVHMIEEYARHCGHADLVRECIDGRTGQ